MGDATRASRVRRLAGPISVPIGRARERAGRQAPLITPLAQPRIAFLVALCVYLVRAALNPHTFQVSDRAYFNYLADAFLHGQLSLRLHPPSNLDLIFQGSHVYVYWPPFPALLITPLVMIFGVAVSDVIYTAIFAAVSIALLAKLLDLLDAIGIAPLSAEYRAILVAACGFGSVLLILAPVGTAWFTAQVVGWVCVLTASIVAFLRPDRLGYALTGLALSCAMATRLGLLFAGVWLAFAMLRRDWHMPGRERLIRIACGLLPLVFTLGLLAWYNLARFGHPLEMGLAWHNFDPENYGADFARYGVFNLHYLPINIFYQFIIFPYAVYKEGVGSGLFWMTPILIGGLYALWNRRRDPLVWSLALSCLLIYIPIGLVMGTGYVFGSRYLLDLMVPLLVLTAIGIRHWRPGVIHSLMVIGLVTFGTGSSLHLIHTYLTGK
jgi:hypothetical protein